jgi:hypothetical protein
VFLKLDGFENPVTAAYFDDGQLVTIEGNGTATGWIVDPVDWIALVCKAAKRNLTQTEWEQYLPVQEYRKTCENNP